MMAVAAVLALSVLCAQATRAAEGEVPPMPPLKENVSLSVKGVLMTDLLVDFTWSGTGPNLAASTLVTGASKEGNLLRFEGTIEEESNRFRLTYTLSGQLVFDVALPRPGGAASRTVLNLALNSTAILKVGEPLTVLDRDGKKIILTLTKKPKS